MSFPTLNGLTCIPRIRSGFASSSFGGGGGGGDVGGTEDIDRDVAGCDGEGNGTEDDDNDERTSLELLTCRHLDPDKIDDIILRLQCTNCHEQEE